MFIDEMKVWNREQRKNIGQQLTATASEEIPHTSAASRLSFF